MSDTAQGPGWWLASDGKWYPPETWTGPPNTVPPVVAPHPTVPPATAPPGPMPSTSGPGADPVGPPPSGPPPAAPTQSAPYGAVAYPSGPQPYGAAAYPPYGQTQQPPGPYSPYGQPYNYGARPQKTNGLAIASLICSCAGIFVVTLVLGVVFGFVARSQIKRSNGTQRGDGLAIAGIIVGLAWAALILLGIIVNATTNPNNSGVIGVSGLFGLIS